MKLSFSNGFWYTNDDTRPRPTSAPGAANIPGPGPQQHQELTLHQAQARSKSWTLCLSDATAARPPFGLTFRVVISGAYSAQRPRDEDDVINVGHVVAKELCPFVADLLHTYKYEGR